MARTPAKASTLPRPTGASAAEFLDRLLPFAKPTATEVHYQAAVLEVGDSAQLLELAADSLLRPFLLCRLAPNVALVDPGHADALAEALRRRGHTPKVLKPSGPS